MNCQEARSFVEDALDRSLSARVKRRLDLHLQHCKECRDFFEAERVEFVRWYRAVNCDCGHSHSLPTDFADRLVAAVMAPRPLPFFLRMPRWALVAASIAIMFMGVVFAGVVGSGLFGARSGSKAVIAKETPAPREVAFKWPDVKWPAAETTTRLEETPIIEEAPIIASAPAEPPLANTAEDSDTSDMDEISLSEVSFSPNQQYGEAEVSLLAKNQNGASDISFSANQQDGEASMNMQTIKTTARQAVLAAAVALGASGAGAADWTVSENIALTEDTTVDALTVESGVTLDLNGYKLYCSSISGSGTITSPSPDTDLTMPGGTCWASQSAAQSSHGNVANLFNNNTTYVVDATHRFLLAESKLPVSIDYDFGEGNAKVVNAYKIWAGWSERAPKKWTLYGSNKSEAYHATSNDDWVAIDSHSGETAWTHGSGSGNDVTAEDRTYFCANTTAYRYYRLYVEERVGPNGYFELVQLEYFNAPAAGEVHLDVADGSTAWPSSITFSGNVKIVKEGAGTLAASGDLNLTEGALAIKSGSVTVGGIMRIGYAAGKSAAVEIDDGALTLNFNDSSGTAIVVGDSGTGTLTINGGTVTVPYKDVYFAYNSGSSGTINLNGGTLVTRRILTKDGTSHMLNFNGGTLKANGVVQYNGFIQSGITVNVGENGGTIDSGNLSDETASNKSRVFIAAALGQAGDAGAMTFKGGKTVNIEGAVNYAGGTIVELGTKLVVNTNSARDAILANFTVDGRSTLADGGYDVLVASGLTAADLAKVSFVNCTAGTSAALDNNDNPTKIVVSLAAATGLSTSAPTLVFPGKTLDDIKYASFTSRMFGKAVNMFNELDSISGYNKKLYYSDGGRVTNLVVEFQGLIVNGTSDGVRCVVVSFTDDGTDVYATALGARYAAGANLGYVFYNGGTSFNGAARAITASRDVADYNVCDIRWTPGEASVWTLDADKNWSDFSGYDSLTPDDVVLIEATGVYTLTVDVDVAVKGIEFVNGSAAKLKVDTGRTLETDSITGLGYLWVADGAMFYVDSTLNATSLLNHGTVVKRVASDVSIPVNNGSSGTTIVSNGTLKVLSHIGNGTAHAIRVVSGATYDLNGVADVTANVTLEGGATIANTGAAIGSDKKQTVKITLEGNATAAFSNDFGLIGPSHGATRLELCSNTLTLNGGGKQFWLDNTTIIGDGTIYVDHGWLHPKTKDSVGADCTLNIPSGGGLDLEANLTVANFVNSTKSGNIKGSSMLTVTGQLTPGSAAIPKLTLASGATIKASATKSQTVSSAFNASGTITIDAEAITAQQLKAAENSRIPVLTVPTANNGGNWTVDNPPVPGARAKWVDNGNGTSTLYICKPTGTMFIIR